MRKTWVLTLLLLMCVFMPAAQTNRVWANGTETLGKPSITIQSGTGMTAAGTGLITQPGTINVNVPEDSVVKQALLYWECRGNEDKNVIVNGNINVVGQKIGGPNPDNQFPSRSFRSDITGLITPGANTLTVEGLNCDVTANNGAGVLVIFDQGIATEFSGEATVLDASVNLTVLQIDTTEVTAGPLPPEGGSDSDSVANLNVGNGAITSGTASALTIGAGSQSFSEAEVQNLNLNLLSLLLVGASVIRAEAEAICDPDGNASVSGNSEIADLAINTLLGPVNIPVSFPPNTVLADLNIAGLGQVKIVANEQTGSAMGGEGEITVNALHITLSTNIPLVGTVTVADIVISSAYADIVCDTDESDIIIIRDGDDFARAERETIELSTTKTQAFKFNATDFDRIAKMILFVGDAQQTRPDVILIKTFNTSGNLVKTIKLIDRLDASDGSQWDTETISVPVPAGVSKVTVQVQSKKDSKSNLTGRDSLVWVLAAFTLPTAEEANTFSGRATVARVSILDALNVVLGDTGPLPSSGGKLEETGVILDIPGVFSSGTGAASTMGAGNQSSSEATVEELELNLSLAGLITSATVITAETTAECDVNGKASVNGESIITDLVINGNTINITGAANQTIQIGPAKIIINEQIRTVNNGVGDITVNALHIIVPGVGELPDPVNVIIASAHSDISCN
ncbi:MAG TPA: choice-of-anchor P family protein [Thermodesulfobacteriota bacterium]|nr:choice-of-anchor P family protein [Thermodesulfobacteriota bacterium]